MSQGCVALNVMTANVAQQSPSTSTHLLPRESLSTPPAKPATSPASCPADTKAAMTRGINPRVSSR